MMAGPIHLNAIDEALAELHKGRMIIVVDDESRENEGDLVALADRVTPETVNFMIRKARGLLCAPITEERAAELSLPPMVSRNTDAHGTAFTVSVDHCSTTTGISAYERADTIKELCNPGSRPEHFRRPGHVFPLTAKKGGVLERPGHTEAAVDLARLCGAYPAALICEMIKDDGTMARLPDLHEFALEHKLMIVSIKDLILYRQRHDPFVKREAEIRLPTKYGQFKLIGYSNTIDHHEHLALVKGVIRGDRPVLVRVHSECMTGDVFHSQRCDCGEQLEASLARIEAEGSGILIYMRQEGRGIGLMNKIKAYALQEQGYDTVEANLKLGFAPDLRDYTIAAQILKEIGVKRLRLLTNNPRKAAGLQKLGMMIEERIPLQLPPNDNNAAYLRTKKNKLGHWLELPELVKYL